MPLMITTRETKTETASHPLVSPKYFGAYDSTPEGRAANAAMHRAGASLIKNAEAAITKAQGYAGGAIRPLLLRFFRKYHAVAGKYQHSGMTDTEARDCVYHFAKLVLSATRVHCSIEDLWAEAESDHQHSTHKS